MALGLRRYPAGFGYAIVEAFRSRQEACSHLTGCCSMCDPLLQVEVSGPKNPLHVDLNFSDYELFMQHLPGLVDDMFEDVPGCNFLFNMCQGLGVRISRTVPNPRRRFLDSCGIWWAANRCNILVATGCPACIGGVGVFLVSLRDHNQARQLEIC